MFHAFNYSQHLLFVNWVIKLSGAILTRVETDRLCRFPILALCDIPSDTFTASICNQPYGIPRSIIQTLQEPN